MKFSVLISVYEKETQANLLRALNSIFKEQTILPNEVILVKDGPLNDALEAVITQFKTEFSTLLKVVALASNVGLGEALNIGLTHCSNEFIARMDSDDISLRNRFELQLDVFKRKPHLDLLGGYIGEFSSSPSQMETIRKVPLSAEQIKKSIKVKNPINHVTAMFKKSSIQKAGGYLPLFYNEDYYLWVRMYVLGMNIENIDQVLVAVQTGDEMLVRRSSHKLVKSVLFLQKFMLKNKVINGFEYLRNIWMYITFIYSPISLKRRLYKWFLREKFEEKSV